MRGILTILIVMTLLTTSGLAIAQVTVFPDLPEDVSHEYKDTPPDDNGLPPADTTVPTFILDSKVYYGSGGTQVWHNEWVVPEFFPDGHGGRTRSYLLPGPNDFYAMYGEWQDRDGDQVILFTNDTDPNNEWNGQDEGNTTQMLGYIKPGYHPNVISDYWILGDFLFTNDTEEAAMEHDKDFEYVDLDDGLWAASWTIPMFDEAIMEEHTVHTVADGFDVPTDPGYACDVSNDECLVDVDRYDVLDQNVADLYNVALTVAGFVADEAADAVFNGPAGPYIDAADEAAAGVLIKGIDAVIRNETNEADPSGPHPSMLDYDYLTDAHAYMDITPWGYYHTGALILALRCCGMPTGPDTTAQGLSPIILGVQGDTGIWQDKDGDYDIDEVDSYQGTCNAVDLDDTSTRRGYFNVTLEPVDDDGNPTTWGTTGVYVFRSEGDTIEAGGETAGAAYLDEAVVDALDFRLDNYVVAGGITLRLTCDNDDPGDWFSTGAWLLLPEGTNGFNIRATTEAGVGLQFGDALAGSTITEAVQDQDVWRSWN